MIQQYPTPEVVTALIATLGFVLSVIVASVRWVQHSITKEIVNLQSEQRTEIAQLHANLLIELDTKYIRRDFCAAYHENNVTRIDLIERRMDLIEEQMRELIKDTKTAMEENVKAVRALTNVIASAAEEQNESD